MDFSFSPVFSSVSSFRLLPFSDSSFLFSSYLSSYSLSSFSASSVSPGFLPAILPHSHHPSPFPYFLKLFLISMSRSSPSPHPHIRLPVCFCPCSCTCPSPFPLHLLSILPLILLPILLLQHSFSDVDGLVTNSIARNLQPLVLGISPPEPSVQRRGQATVDLNPFYYAPQSSPTDYQPRFLEAFEFFQLFFSLKLGDVSTSLTVDQSHCY